LLVIWHRLQRTLTTRRRAGAKDGPVGRPRGMWRRRSNVRSVERLLDAASRILPASQFPHPDWEAPLLLRAEVVWACRPALLAIKDVLGDPRQPISAVALRHLKTFLTDPSASPLFGTDPTAAAATRLHGAPPTPMITALPDHVVSGSSAIWMGWEELSATSADPAPLRSHACNRKNG
jgi:hypothetical protein